MELNPKEHNSEPAIQQERLDTSSIDDEVPDGYYKSPTFIGTIAAIGLGMFSVRLHLSWAEKAKVEYH